MKVITRKSDDTIVFIGQLATETEQGIETEKGIYLNTKELNVFDVIDYDEVEVEKFCYSEEKGFFVNENYSETIDPNIEILNLRKQNERLLNKTAELEQTMDSILTEFLPALLGQ